MLRATALATGTNGDGSLIGTRNGIDGKTLVGATALLLAFGASRLQSRQPSPRLLAGYIMESRIGFSHGQSQLGSCGRWLLDARMDPKVTPK